MASLELWLGMASLELWLRMTDEHEEPLSCGSGWWVLPVWVGMLWHVRMGPDRLPPQYVADEFGSLGTLWTMFVLGTPPGVTEYGL